MREGTAAFRPAEAGVCCGSEQDLLEHALMK